MATLVLSANDVNQVIAEFTPDELVDLMAQVFFQYSLSNSTEANPKERNAIVQPHRLTIPMQNHTALFMPSRIASFGTAMKVVSVPTASAPKEIRDRGLPASTLVFDEETGAVSGIVNANNLTALRNAAGSLLATRLFLPSNKPPRKLVAFGAGAQISAHISLFLSSYPSLTTVSIFNRTAGERLSSLLSSLEQKFSGRVKLVGAVLPSNEADGVERDKLRDALRDADIVITATSSTEPLFPSGFISPGTHLCLIGSYKPTMHEIDTDLVRRARKIVVDSKEACKEEAGELIAAKVPSENYAELGTLFDLHATEDQVPVWSPRPEVVEQVRTAGDVTIFKSVGVGIQDVAIAHAVVDCARRMGVGAHVDL